jgi:hypothetical protein
VSSGELAECGLLCFFRGGQPGGQRLFICIQRGEAGAEPFIFSFGSEAATLIVGSAKRGSLALLQSIILGNDFFLINASFSAVAAVKATCNSLFFI